MLKLTLYTEKKNIHLLRHLIATHFESFTMMPSTGFWQGKREKVLIVEVFTREEKDREQFDKLARAIKRLNRQTCVLVTEQAISWELI